MPRKAKLNPTLGPEVCDWIETYLVHGPGDIQGQPIEIDDEFRAFLYRCYEIYPRDHALAGRRVYRRAIISRPKGRAKSELAGMLCCAELLGPVRFDGWDARGHPVGKPVTSPEVLCVATEEGQAGNTFDNVVYMLRQGLAAEAYPNIDAGLTRVFLTDGGSIEPITAVASSKDGGKSTFVVCDETHLWVDPRLKRLHATLTRNVTKRRLADGWLLETSTMFGPGEGSVAEETHRVAKGMAGVLFDHKQAPDVDITDDDALEEALRYVYGPAAAWMDLRQIIQAEFRDPTKRESDSRRYWLNQPWTTEERFVTAAQWDACADSNRAISPGSRVVLGLDGSFNGDTTGVVVVSLDERPHVDVVGCWRRPDNAPADWEVDVLSVEEAIRQAAKRWQVVELAADPYRWTRSLQVLADENIPATVFPQTTARMTPATRRLYDLITTQGLSHSGDPRLREHMLNAVLKNDNRGYRLAKPNKDSPYRVDLAVCTVMAIDRASTLGPSSGPNVWSIREVMEELRARQSGQTESQPRADVREVPRQVPTMAEPDTNEGEDEKQPEPKVITAKFIPLSEMPPWRGW